MNKSAGVELKPCPFCGSKSVLHDSTNVFHTKGFIVSCTNTGCPASNGRWSETEEKAIGKWNSRQSPQPDKTEIPTNTASVTAEEVLKKHMGEDWMKFFNENWHLDNCPIGQPMTTIADVLQTAMEEFANLRVKELQEENSRMKKALEEIESHPFPSSIYENEDWMCQVQQIAKDAINNK